jgi:ribosomal protein L4
MALQDVYNMDGTKVSEIDLADEIFNVPVKQHVLQCVVRGKSLTARRALVVPEQDPGNLLCGAEEA